MSFQPDGQPDFNRRCLIILFLVSSSIVATASARQPNFLVFPGR